MLTTIQHDSVLEQWIAEANKLIAAGLTFRQYRLLQCAAGDKDSLRDAVQTIDNEIARREVQIIADTNSMYDVH